MSFALTYNIIKLFYILLHLTSFILSEEVSYLTINIEENNKFFLKNEENFKVLLNHNYDDYYKITINKYLADEVDKNNYVLSFYQKDSEFKNRKQLSQGIGKVEMWLNKAQVDNEFFIEIEVESERPISIANIMNIYLTRYNITELEFEKQFNYYVSEENQIMKFKMKEEIPDIIPLDLNNYILTIWAKGNKNISSVMEGIAYDKPSNQYNYYRINMIELKENNNTFELTINGTVNDLINIGTLLFHIETDDEGNEIYVTREIGDTLDGLELTGYLKPNERVDFRYLKTAFKGPLGYFADINNNLQNLIFIGEEEGLLIKHIQFTSYEESFFVIQLPQKISFLNTFYIDYPQIIGVNYFRMISENKQIGILPMKLEDFNFLTYEIIPVGGEIEVYIFNCENYPLCSPTDENIEKVSDYETFSYTFSKDEWNNEISPISKNQKMLLISCINRINKEKDYCEILTNMRTEKNIIPPHFVYQELPVTRYIRKNDENKYKIQKNHDTYMNIEVLSGKVEIPYDGENKFSIGSQKQLFIIPANKVTDLTVKGSTDSVYRIFDYYSMRNNNSLILGSNYLFELKDNMTLKPYGYIEEYIGYGTDYLGIYPNNNCKFKVESFSNYEEDDGTKISKQYGFYQDIFSGLNTTYKISKLKESKSPCLFYTSSYRLNSKNGISLEDNSYQTFLFKNNSKFNFSYAHAQKENNVKIYFNLLKNGNYTVNISLNNKEYKYEESNIIISNKTIELNSSFLIEKCEYFNPICKILISVGSNGNDESILTIGINNDEVPKEEEEKEEEIIDDEEEETGRNEEENEKGEEEEEPKEVIDDDEEEKGEEELKTSENGDDDDDDDNKVLIILLCSISVIIVIIIIIGYSLFKTRRENRNLAERVNQISFQDDDARNTLLL